jgi:DNA-directed RNA polymerases I, II, and III subunit RPABC1
VFKDKTKIIVKFILFEHIRPNLIKENILEIFSNNIKARIIIILKKKPNNSILKIIKEPKNSKVEIFWYSELLINICKHNLVPKHEILNKNEEEILLLKLRINSKNKLPQIFKADPISKWYGAEYGNIFKISRNSITSGKTVYYRCVK